MAHLSGEVEAESEDDDDDDDDCKKGSMDEVCVLSSNVLNTGNLPLGRTIRRSKADAAL